MKLAQLKFGFFHVATIVAVVVVRGRNLHTKCVWHCGAATRHDQRVHDSTTAGRCRGAARCGSGSNGQDLWKPVVIVRHGHGPNRVPPTCTVFVEPRVASFISATSGRTFMALLRHGRGPKRKAGLRVAAHWASRDDVWTARARCIGRVVEPAPNRRAVGGSPHNRSRRALITTHTNAPRPSLSCRGSSSSVGREKGIRPVAHHKGRLQRMHFDDGYRWRVVFVVVMWCVAA